MLTGEIEDSATHINTFTDALRTYEISPESQSRVVRGASAPSIDFNLGDNLEQAMRGRWTHINYRKRTMSYDHFENRLIFGVCIQLRKLLHNLASKQSLKAISLSAYLKGSREFLDRYVFRPEFREVDVNNIDQREIEFYTQQRDTSNQNPELFMAIDIFWDLPELKRAFERLR